MPMINLDLCRGCGICVDACPNNAITIENKKAVIDMNLCLGCEVCISYCPNGAITSYRVRRKYPYPWPIPYPQHLQYFQPHFYRAYYPRLRRRQRGWRFR